MELSVFLVIAGYSFILLQYIHIKEKISLLFGGVALICSITNLIMGLIGNL